MYRTHTCGELRITHVAQPVTLCGWVQTIRDMGGMTFIDLRDRYGITQLAFNMESNSELGELSRKLGREFVIMVKGTVAERSAKNNKMETGDIEIICSELHIINPSDTPPFTIEENTDGGEELRMKYRYLDLRRKPLQNNLMLRHKAALETRKYLSDLGFMEIETPFLIKSTPEGARDFVVPSRVHHGEFYALPQSPQTFKQLLMVSGFDRYFQIVRCFRDEDLRADRQPEFTQIDCEMAFVEREDVLQTFEGLLKHILKEVRGINIEKIPRMSYDDAMKYYGSDKPDLRFGMKFEEITEIAKGKGFPVFDQAEIVVGICAKGAGNYTRKQLDELTEFVKKPQIGAKGLVYARINEDGSIKSSVDKFYNEEHLKDWARQLDAEKGDLILVMAGETEKTRKQLSELRLEMGNQLGLRSKDDFKPLWVLDFPMFEFNELDNLPTGQAGRWFAMHHPFTSPNAEDIEAMMNGELSRIKANAYDLVLNGTEVAGGSIRIFNKNLQAKVFEVLGFTKEEAEEKFGFLMNAFEFGAPPHGGIAFGFDRLCALMGGSDSIRDFIAFPKNNAGRDVMIDSPSMIDDVQLKELGIEVKKV